MTKELLERIAKLEQELKTARQSAREIEERYESLLAGLSPAREVTGKNAPGDSLQEGEGRYRTIFENTGNASILIAKDTTILLANSNFAALTGYTREELEGRISWTIFIDPVDLEKMKQYHYARRSARGKAPDSYEFSLITRSGEKRNIFLTISLIPGTDESIASCMDITDRKKAQESLNDWQRFIERVIDLIPDTVYVHDLKYGRNILDNRKLPVELGLTLDEHAELGDEFVSTLMHPDDLPRYRRHLERINSLRTDETAEFEYRLRDTSGLYRWFYSRDAVFARRDDGDVSQIISIVTNITGRKEAEESLRQSEERYRAILDNMQEAYYEVDLEGNFTFFNTSAMVRLRYTDEEMKGMNFRRFVDSENEKKVFRSYHNVFVTGEPVAGFDWEVINKEENRIPVESSVALRKDAAGAIIGFAGVVRDISERKKTQEDLRQSEERFKDLARLLPETVYETDGKGNLTFVNETAMEKFRYNHQDFDRGLNVLDMLVPEDREQGSINIGKVLSGERIGLNEYTALRKDGTTFPVLVHSTCIVKDGKPMGARGFVIDVSDKKTLEEQFVRAEKMEAIGTLAGGIAHDFNNLLMGILGNVSLMLMNIEASHPFYDRLKSMEEYVRQGSDLTKQFLGFARGGKYEVKPTHMGEFVRRSSEMFGRTKKDVRIHRKVQDDLWTVDVDRGQIEQVMLNLFVNAWQAMPGGGDLYISVENVELNEMDVAPFGIAAGRFVLVSVADTGIGMDEATREKIFEPFFTTKEKGRGTGLGLASVYGIVRNHKGLVSVESEKGAGSTFRIYLPASDRDIPEDKKASENIQTGKETILLIDDETMILEVGSQMLASLGYTVLTAGGGAEGIAIYQRNPGGVHLVVLDMIMPELGGRDTFDRLKMIDADVKVLLSSGYSIEGQAEEIMESGCKGFIQKPFTLKELAGKIREVLDCRETLETP